MISNAAEIMEHSTDSSTSRDIPSPDYSPQDNDSFVSSCKAPYHKDSSSSAWVPGRKRKHSFSKDDPVVDKIPLSPIFPDQRNLPCDQDNNILPKKPKLDFDKIPSQRSHLPMEVWQYVFSFLDPKTLGILLRVNRAFNSYLTSSETYPQDTSTCGVLKPIGSASVWSYSRKSFYPGMPRPLANMTELDMWKLIGATTCQFCRRNGSTDSSISSPWERGPGVDGVRIIWPFGIRTCSQCLFARAKKDVDVMLSPLPTFLLEGLVFALITTSMHVIPSVVLRSSQLPPGLQMSKYYYDFDIKCLLGEFERVKALGAATLEEWTKGLESERLRKITDVTRWEQWENSGGLRDVKAQSRTSTECFPRTKSSCKPNSSEMPTSENASSSQTRKSADGERYALPGGKTHGFRTSPYYSGQQGYPTPEPAHRVQQSRIERNLRDVNEAKSLRRAEIERRCLELSPPLTAAILSHMDSFSAAIQIPHPLSDRDWEILKPRLISQREAAEKKEYDRLKQSQLLEAKSEERRQEEAKLKEAKASLDRQWDEVQRPIRDQVTFFAEELINTTWSGGSLLTKDKCPQFAADVLMHVRNKFYARIQEEDAVARASGIPVRTDSPNLPPTRKLILENMKWIFDAKIKPLTEKHQKELFLCNGCDNNPRFYGFEGVIQHYAAKHTTALSRGNVVVYWRAEWPEKPPFHPNPNAARALFQASSQSGFTQAHCYTGQQGTANPYIATPEQRHRMLSDSQFQSPRSFGHSPFGGPYAYMHGPYQPPSPSMSPYYPTPHPSYVFPTTSAMATSTYDQSSAYSPSLNASASPATYPSQISQALLAYPSPGYRPSSLHSQNVHNVPYSKKASGFLQHTEPDRLDMYQHQLNDVARIARDVWNATSGIKDLPASIRAYVLIYHVVFTSKRQLDIEPSITLFADGLNNHPQMKPMRNLNGLVCKRCTDEENQGVVNPHARKPKLYSLPALISHFQSTHMEHPSSRLVMHQNQDSCDSKWRTDMILLPDMSSMRSSLRTPGMDEFKLQIILQALDSTLATPPALHSQSVEPTRSSATVYRRYSESQSNFQPELIDDLNGDRIHDSSSYENLSGRFIDTETDLRKGANVPVHVNGYSEGRHTGFFIRSPYTSITSESASSDPALIENKKYELQEAPGFHKVRGHGFRSPPSHFARHSRSDLKMRLYEPYEESLPLSSLRSDSSYPAERLYTRLSSDQYDAMKYSHHMSLERPGETNSYPVEYILDDAMVLKNKAPFSALEKPDNDAEETGEVKRYLKKIESSRDTNILECEESDQNSRMGPQSTRKNFHLQTSDDPIWHRSLTADDIMEHGVYASQAGFTSNKVWKRRGDVNPIREGEVRRQNRASGSPELGYIRLGRKVSGPMESRRPHSRFDRYEAQRQEPLRSSSRSSSIKEGSHPDSQFFHDQKQRFQQSQATRYYIEEPSRSYARLEINQPIPQNVRRDVTGYTEDFGGDQVYYDATKEI